MNPGSEAAIAAGCNCPVLDNGRGAGYLGTGFFVISAECPVHSPSGDCLNGCGRRALEGERYCSSQCEAEARGDSRG